MRILKCNRCDEELGPKNNRKAVIKAIVYHPGGIPQQAEDIDLCRDCFGLFEDFLYHLPTPEGGS